MTDFSATYIFDVFFLANSEESALMSKREDKKEAGEDVELEGAETLLSRLRRQYRMMERNRRQYRDEATVVLDRQR